MKERFFLDFNSEKKNLLIDLILGDHNYNSSKFIASDWGTYFLKPASPIMYGIIDLHDFIMVYLVFIVFFVTFMLFIILKESTISENDEITKFKRIKLLYNVQFNHHTLLEAIWIIVPSIILLTIAIPSFIILYAMDIIPHHDFTIKVIGHQWYWSYEYVMENLFAVHQVSQDSKSNNNISNFEEEVLHRYTFDSYMIPSDELKPNQFRLLETTNPLVIPIARYASVTVTSTDVIHAFAVPSLGIKIDAIPGRLNTISLYIMELGHFYGQCSELCGVNHGFMPIEIYCVDLIGFSIYKAALASKIISKEDVTCLSIDSVSKNKLLRKYYDELINTYISYLLEYSSKKKNIKPQMISRFIISDQAINFRFFQKVLGEQTRRYTNGFEMDPTITHTGINSSEKVVFKDLPAFDLTIKDLKSNSSSIFYPKHNNESFQAAFAKYLMKGSTI